MKDETLSLIWSRRSIRDFESRERDCGQAESHDSPRPQRREYGDVLYIGSGGPGEEEKTK